MSSHRKLKIPYTDAPRGMCRWCGEEITKEHMTVPKLARWHTACFDQYDIQANPSRLRRELFKIDKGVCRLCGTDTTKNFSKIHKILDRYKKFLRQRQTRLKIITVYSVSYTYSKEISELESKLYRKYPVEWQADHIIELKDGGSHELSNVQTLCVECHKVKTTESKRARRMLTNDTRL